MLIVDDEKNIRLSLKKYLSLEDIDSIDAESGEVALAVLERESFDAVVLDLKLPGMSGQDVLERMRERGIFTPALMISAHGQIPDAVRALQSGARDYLVKPFDPAELIVKLRALVNDLTNAGGAKCTASPTGLIGQSAAMRNIAEKIARLAGTDVTVLITGESGTGKEVAAREIHDRGNNAAEPFVAVNIGGVNENLMESELFGHEKGAFTGAAARKQGLFELAGRGTLFLDEIGEMPMPLQVKLLRVLQERKIRRLGGVGDIPVNARIVSATNRNLEEMVAEGRFREDLFYRLNVFRLELPPLREREGDIPLLADFLLKKLAARVGYSRRKGAPELSPEALAKLCAYSFPGNIRELENILERALIYGDGDLIRADDIELRETRQADALGIGAASLEAIEKEAIRECLARHNGNRTKAAEELGVTRKTILNKIKLYGL